VHANGPLLLGVTPFNPLTFIGAAFLLTLGALAAGFFPARRATRVDPIRSLHDE
jgi:ABC-type antimicrobial peptide transport system permease subunit